MRLVGHSSRLSSSSSSHSFLFSSSSLFLLTVTADRGAILPRVIRDAADLAFGEEAAPGELWLRAFATAHGYIDTGTGKTDDDDDDDDEICECLSHDAPSCLPARIVRAHCMFECASRIEPPSASSAMAHLALAQRPPRCRR